MVADAFFFPDFFFRRCCYRLALAQLDYNGRLSLTQFEELVQPLVGRMDAPVLRALQEAGVTKEQLGSVEIVGGSTRQVPDFHSLWFFHFFSSDLAPFFALLLHSFISHAGHDILL